MEITFSIHLNQNNNEIMKNKHELAGIRIYIDHYLMRSGRKIQMETTKKAKKVVAVSNKVSKE